MLLLYVNIYFLIVLWLLCWVIGKCMSDYMEIVIGLFVIEY